MSNPKSVTIPGGILIHGKGNSLWGDSKGVYRVDKIKFNSSYSGRDFPYEIQCFSNGKINQKGEATDWRHYTDSQIVEEVEKKLMHFVQAAYPKVKITGIFWSEQGMQPKNGWSFDVTYEEKA